MALCRMLPLYPCNATAGDATVRCPESFVDRLWIRLASYRIQMHKGQDPSCHHSSCLCCILLVPRALVGSPQLTDGDQPHAVPKRPQLGGWLPHPLIVCKEEVCAEWWWILSCDSCPCSCKPAPYCCCQGAADEDVGECGILPCALLMWASVACCL